MRIRTSLATIGATIVAAIVLAQPAPVAAVSIDVVIRQVYGGGGNTGATFTHDFLELYNRGDTAVPLEGWSVQYGPAGGPLGR